MIKILYIYRHPDMGYSIGNVFRPIENDMRKYAEVDSIYLPVPNYSLKGLWKNIQYAKTHCKKYKYDIIHITGTENYLIPFLRKQKIIVTVHDLASFITNNPIKKFFKKLLFIKSLQFADTITCISDKTKHEIFNAIPKLNRKVVTIYNPISPLYTYKPKTFNEENPSILHIGTKANKNLENTIKALEGINCQLRIIGVLNSTQIDSLKQYNINYTNVWGLTDEEILNEYECCDIVNFPSLYEGFGMPIIEGQSIGRVVLTSNLSPMKDVAGNASVLVNPNDIHSIRMGYEELIKNHENYVKNGLKNVSRFHLQTITKQYRNCYMSVIKGVDR